MRRVLVLGGGMAGLAAAHALSRTPALRARFSVEVVQPGWRLGGQVACGRGPHGRIEEHGLHLLLGCYENTFRLVREAHAALGRDWRPSFRPIDAVTMLEPRPEGLAPWTLRFPRNGRTPGDGGPLGARDLAGMARRGARILASDALGARRDPGGAARRAALVARLVAATLRGLRADRVAERGYDALDDEDLREWLLRHGAGREVADSVILKTAYDLVFAAPAGPGSGRGLAAGVGLRFFHRAIGGYKCAIGWPMTAGTADVLCAPLAEVLVRNGVRLSFFQRAREVVLDGAELRRVRLGVQARVPPGWSPLREVRGRPAWPSSPPWPTPEDAARWAGADPEQAAGGPPDVAERVLERGRDVDVVVLAVGLGALGQLGPGLAGRPALRGMLDHLPTAATVALQVWTAGGGEPGPMGNSGHPALGGVGDLAWQLPAEDWPAGAAPGHVLYACHRVEDGALPDPEALADAFLAGPSGRSLLRGAPLARYVRLNVEPTDRYALAVPGSTRWRLAAHESGVDGLVLAGAWTRTGWNLGAVESAVMSGLAAARAVSGEPEEIPGERDPAWLRSHGQ